jgi:hypothetical protein
MAVFVSLSIVNHRCKSMFPIISAFANRGFKEKNRSNNEKRRQTEVFSRKTFPFDSFSLFIMLATCPPPVPNKGIYIHAEAWNCMSTSSS